VPTHKSVDLRHQGGMHFAAAPSSGHPLEFDDRRSNQGGSPVETMLSALGACTAMDVISITAKKRQRVEAYEIHVTGSQREEYPQVFTEIVVVHDVTGPGLSEAAIRRTRRRIRHTRVRLRTARITPSPTAPPPSHRHRHGTSG